MATSQVPTHQTPLPVRGQSARGAGPATGFRLGRVAGVHIYVDLSLLLVFGLLLVQLGLGLLPQWHPDWNAGLRWAVALAAAVSFFGSVLLHELSHALVGRATGISVSRITLFMFGGMAHMDHEPREASAELKMAIAGPLASLVIGIAATVLGSWLAAAPALDSVQDDPAALVRSLSPVATVLLWLGPLNVLLAVFNLLPGFPLDGGRVLRALWWWKTGDLARATRYATKAGVGLSWLLIGLGGLMALGLVIPVLGGGLGPGLWLVLIGWFLGNAARASYLQLYRQQALENVAVRELMWTRPEVARPDENLQQVVRTHLLHVDQQLIPIVDEGVLLGAVTVDAVRQVPEPAWASTPVTAVMTPASELIGVAPDSEAAEALRLLGESGAQELVVTHGHRLLGLVRQQDLLRWLAIHGRSSAPTVGPRQDVGAE